MPDPTSCSAKRKLVHGVQKVLFLNTLLCPPLASRFTMTHVNIDICQGLPLCFHSLLKRPDVFLLGLPGLFLSAFLLPSLSLKSL